MDVSATNFEDRMIAVVERYDMFSHGDRVLIGLSGGQDSLALLHCLHGMREKRGISLAAAHLHHGMRGAEADEDVAFLREFCDELNVALFVKRVSVPELARREGISLEQAGRRARYNFLNETADAEDFARIAVGHTATDRAETVLMNILRGAGLEGLQGIQPTRGRIVRPLIGIGRDETAEYCREHGLEPRVDRTNLDTDTYLRNRIRHRLMPLIRQEYAEGVDRALLRLAEVASRELEWTRPQVTEAFEGAADIGEDELTFDLQQLQQMQRGLLARVLRKGLRQLRGDLKGFSMQHISDLQDLVLEGETGGRVHLPFTIQALRGYNEVVLSIGGEQVEAGAWEVVVPVGGTRRLPVGGHIAAELCPPPDDPQRAGDNEVYLDADKTPDAFVVRNWRHGERILPLGMDGSKKLQDVFVDSRVRERKRNRIPIVLDKEGRVLWICGLRMSRLAAIGPDTDSCVHLTWHRDEDKRIENGFSM